MDRVSAVAKRRKLCSGGGGFSNCATKCLCACIFKKPISSGFDHLTDDILAEILLRLPAKFVFRCKSVSKRWLSLTSSLSFTRSFILTHFSNSNSNDINKIMLLFKVACRLPWIGHVYALDSSSSSSLPFAFDFIPPLRPDNYDINLYYQLNPRKVTDRLLTDICLIESYAGLVLLRAVFQDPPLLPSSYHRNLPYYHYYVCNPITKHWVELPLISTLDLVGFTCYHLQKAQGEGQDSRVWADVDSYDNLIKHNPTYDPNNINFTVVSINPDEQALVHIIHVLSSADETAGWKIFFVPFPPDWRSAPFAGNLLFMNGKFHWCGENSIAAYDPFGNPMQCDVIPLPQMDPLDTEATKLFTLEAFQGRLRLVTSFAASRLVAWDLVDYANKVWVKKVDVSYDHHRLMFQSFVGAAAKDKVYMKDLPSTIMLFDVRNKSLEHVYDLSNDLDNANQLRFVKPFISSPWPTPVPLLMRK